MLSGKVYFVRKGQCCQERSLMLGEVNVREGQRYQGRSMFLGKFYVVGKGQCCQGRSLLLGRVNVVREVLCCQGR